MVDFVWIAAGGVFSTIEAELWPPFNCEGLIRPRVYQASNSSQAAPLLATSPRVDLFSCCFCIKQPFSSATKYILTSETRDKSSNFTNEGASKASLSQYSYEQSLIDFMKFFRNFREFVPRVINK